MQKNIYLKGKKKKKLFTNYNNSYQFYLAIPNKLSIATLIQANY